MAILTLFLSLTITSTVFAGLQAIGALGKGELRKISFLPDGRILRVLANRIEFVDPNTGATIERFADRTEFMGKVTVSGDSSRLAIVRSKRSPAQTVIEVWETTENLSNTQFHFPSIPLAEPRSNGTCWIR